LGILNPLPFKNIPRRKNAQPPQRLDEHIIQSSDIGLCWRLLTGNGRKDSIDRLSDRKSLAEHSRRFVWTTGRLTPKTLRLPIGEDANVPAPFD
jgi:hypothetical protein